MKVIVTHKTLTTGSGKTISGAVNVANADVVILVDRASFDVIKSTLNSVKVQNGVPIDRLAETLENCSVVAACATLNAAGQVGIAYDDLVEKLGSSQLLQRKCRKCRGLGRVRISDTDFDKCRACNGTGPIDAVQQFGILYGIPPDKIAGVIEARAKMEAEQGAKNFGMFSDQQVKEWKERNDLEFAGDGIRAARVAMEDAATINQP